MPSKQYGQTRSIQPKTKSITSARSAYNVAIHKPNVIAENCYFSEKTGCSVIYEDGHEYHIEEIEVAQALADYGIDVRLQPENEAKGGFYVEKIINGKKTKKFPEGELNASTWYEQSTLNKRNKDMSTKFKDGLTHAKEKDVEVAIIYDRYGFAHREDVERGIRRFNGQKFDSGPYPFKSIITVNKDREVNFWEQ